MCNIWCSLSFLNGDCAKGPDKCEIENNITFFDCPEDDELSD